MKNYYAPFMACLLFCGFANLSLAQNTITGTVTSDSIKVLPGATVEILGTTVATLTNQDGRYTISAGDQAILVFKFQGYITQEIPTHGRTLINVVLQRNTDSLTHPKSMRQFKIKRIVSIPAPQQASLLAATRLQPTLYLSNRNRL